MHQLRGTKQNWESSGGDEERRGKRNPYFLIKNNIPDEWPKCADEKYQLTVFNMLASVKLNLNVVCASVYGACTINAIARVWFCVYGKTIYAVAMTTPTITRNGQVRIPESRICGMRETTATRRVFGHIKAPNEKEKNVASEKARKM